MAKMFLGKYFPPSMVTKLRNEITNFYEHPDESLFEAWEHYKLSIDRCPNHNMLPVTQIYTFYNGLTLRHHDTINAAAGGTFMKRRPEECYDLIENMTAHHNDWDTSIQWIAHNCETYGGPHSYNDFPATVGQTQNVYAAGAYNQGGSGTLPSNTIINPKEDLNGITTRSGNAYQGPTIPTTSFLLKVVERETEVTKNIPFPERFIVIDFDADPQVPLILEGSFIKTRRALIDVYEGELSLRVGKEAVTFNLDQTARYSDNYDVMSVNRIDLIDMAYEEYSQEVLRFSMSGNPTPSTEPIVSNSSPTLTPFGDSDFLLEETDAFLAIDDEPISSEIDESYYDSDHRKLMNPTMIRRETFFSLKNILMMIQHHHTRTQKGDEKLPVIIAKDLKDEEKTALKKVLKSYKQALDWQISDIKSIDLEFCAHKILMEDAFKPAVQH
uniref:Retrotransposon gag domain-containing protein n=1 Tax=Tanacetum cinerariifolium TaxID=118510 RepID=A0A6L2KA69_TANCI|nr:hypothetical protein [Tanacetum cinerariifolium]